MCESLSCYNAPRSVSVLSLISPITPFCTSFKPLSRSIWPWSLSIYAFFGEQLGARPKDRSVYVRGQATYEKIAETAYFNKGLERLREGSKKLNLALVCSEKDPIDCHRACLVCYNLEDMRERIFHIHTNGKLEKQDQFEQRLVDLHKLTPSPLFQRSGDWEIAVSEAYKKQASCIAYRES